MSKLKQRILAMFLTCILVALGSSAFAVEPAAETVVQAPSNQNASFHQSDSKDVTVSFSLNGVDGDAIGDRTVAAGTELTLPTITGLAEKSPEFLGWSLDPDREETLYQPDDTIPITEHTVLYAMWKHVTVTYVYGGKTVTETVLQYACPTAIPSVPDQGQLTFVGWLDAKGNQVSPAQVPVSEDVTYTANFMEKPKFNTEEHSVYVNGYGDGTFRPSGKTTRAEAAKMVYSLLLPFDKPDSTGFTDVPAGSWYETPINALGAVGILSGYGDKTFLPQNNMTRAEFVTMLAKLFYIESPQQQSFSDVPVTSWAYPYVEYAAARGWVNGYEDGTFRPNGKITRAEAVAILNRVTGRVGDKTAIHSGTLRTFHDVSSDFWAFNDIMEASTPHTHTGTETWTTYTTKKDAGLYQEGYELRCIDNDGWEVKDASYGNFRFDSNGNYTSGNSEIDRYCKEILAKVATKDMTREEQLKALYCYTRDNFHYLKRTDYGTKPVDWEREALLMFQTGYGNCYNYGSAFYCMARQVGYDAKLVSGTIGTKKLAHCWIEITMDKVEYLFDPEQEMLQRENGVSYYDLYRIQKGKTPWTYTPYA